MTDSYVVLGLLSETAPSMPLGKAHTLADKIVDTFRPVVENYREEAERQRSLHRDACDQLARHLVTITELAGEVADLENENDRLRLNLQTLRDNPPAPREVTVLPNTTLVKIVKAAPKILDQIKDRRKIMAIKMLRDMVDCSLLDAKNAVDTVQAEVFSL